MNIPINVIYSEIITNKDTHEKWISLRKPEYFEYRRKWAYNPQNNIVEQFPLNLDIEPTNRCNLQCPFCYRTIAIKNGIGGQFQTLGNLSLETFRTILKQITENGKCLVPAIKLTHRGEPLLNNDIFQMISEAKESGCIDVIINTNATLLTEDAAEKLFEAGLDKLLISIDSPEKTLYEKLRIGASFDSVIKNIKTAVVLRDKMKSYGTLIRTGMVLTQETAFQRDNFLKMFGSIADIVSFNKVHEEVAVDDNGNFIATDGTIKNVKEQKFVDSQLWQRMTINWNGDAEICCENYKQEYALGNVLDKGVADIWNGKQFGQVRELHRRNEWWKIKQCRKCTIPYMGNNLTVAGA